MNEIVPLTRPIAAQATVDSVAKECPSDGFEYPKFSLLNKHARVYISKPVEIEPGVPYQLFDIANSKGWFVAVKSAESGSELVFSTLEDLRKAISEAKEDSDALFSPKRTIPTPSKANIVKFACGDTRLLVGQDNGSILLYDTAQLFTEGGIDVYPLTSTHIQTSHLRYIVPNPGSEPGLSDLVAIVGNDKVQLVNGELEPQGGWAATDESTRPISVDWSPKGKHLAVGLQSGDILTFALTNRTTPNKHIPPTANGPLVSLQWLTPGHTFRTTYANAIQHIVVLDTKSSSAIYYTPDHPFPLSDRTQNSYAITLPKWDTDASSSDDSKALTVVGDMSSVDVEVLGNSANAWFRQSQDNPVSLPLDSAMDDTYLLSLEVDLTDSTAGQPIVYAYLNDGSVQGWHLESAKPYAGMVASSTTTTTTASTNDADMGAEAAAPTPSVFGQPAPTTSAFGQTGFGTQTSSFSSQTTSSFGQTGFGAKTTTSSFGQPSFGQSAFGQPSQPATSSAFGSAQPATGFGAFASGGTSAFGGGGAFGSGAFGSQNTANAFAQQPAFGSTPTPPAAPANQTESAADMTREASMSDSTAAPAFSGGGFGGMGLGGGHPTDPKASNSMFGSFGSNNATPSTQQAPSGFGASVLKPATGFGAFAKTTNAFSNPAPPTVSAFGSTPAATSTTTPAAGSGFGQSGFGQTGFGAASTFGKPAFGQPAFGSSSFGKPASATPAASTGGGFGAFANAPTSSLASTPQTAAPASTTAAPASTGGFAAFASKPSGFGAPAAPSSGDTKPASGFGAFASSGPSVFGSATSTPTPAFGLAAPSDTKPATGFSAFGGSTTAFGAASTSSAFPSTPKKPEETKPAFGSTSTPPPAETSGTPSNSVLFSPTEPKAPEQKTPVTNVFSGIKTSPSPFAKPATGFGAFGNTTPSKDSPFFKKPEETPSKPPVSAFNLTGTSTSTPQTPTPTKGLAFGAPSALGAPKSVFGVATPSSTTTPTKTTAPATGGFGAFSGSTSAFASAASKGSSFGNLLKSGGDEITEAKAPALSNEGDAGKAKAPAGDEKPRTSVLNTPLTPPKKDEKAATSTTSPGVQSERTLEWISGTSGGSSFVEVDARDAREGGGESEDDDLPHSDGESFLTDDSEERDPTYEEDDEDGEVDEEDDLEEGEEEDEDDLEEIDAPAGARSPSSTPQPEKPAIRVTKDDSTPTKPGPGAPAPSPFGLGLGRPSTRPTRSSPLAKAVSHDEEGSDKEEGVDLDKQPAISPRPPVAVLPLKTEDDDNDSAARRPKTPPLLSTLGGGIAAPAPIPAASAGTTPSIFGPPSGSIFGQGSSTSIFGKQSTPSSSQSPTKDVPSLSVEIPGSKPSSVPTFFGKPLDVQSKAAPPRPATAPAPATSGLGISPPVFASSSFQPPSIPHAASSTPNIFSGITTSTFPTGPAPTAGKTAPISVFGAAGAATPSATPAGFNMQGPKPATSVFGIQPATPSPQAAKPSPSGSPGLLSPVNIFGNQTHPVSQTPIKGHHTPVQPPGAGPPANAGVGSPSRPQEPESAMQKACRIAVFTVETDLAELKKLMASFAMRMNSLAVSGPGGTTKADLSRPENWTLGNVKQFGEVLLQYGDDLDSLEERRESYEKQARDLQNVIVKAGMKKEEIARFSKAKDDKEFARMLKARALGPEHSEMQAKLRKNIRIMRDRVQKLETRLVEGKKKLAEANSCKPSFKAPTVDTINRTYRNIEIAIEQQSDEVSRLASRISRLNVGDSGESVASGSVSGGAVRPPGASRTQQRAYNISSTVAETTTAALNGEHSAARLKQVLLRVRKEPLLNTQVLKAPPPPLAYDTPRKPAPSVFGASAFDTSAFNKPFDYPTPPLNGFGSTMGDPSADNSDDLKKILDFSNLPKEDNFHLAEDLSESTGRRSGKSRSHRVVNPNKGQPFVPNTTQTQGGPSPPPPKFDWGPLPKFGSASSPATPAKFVPLGASPSPNLVGSPGSSAQRTNIFSSPSPPAKPGIPIPKGFVSFSSSSGSK